MNPEITLTLSVDQLNMMLQLIGTHPYTQVADLVALIRQQASQQIQAAQQSGARSNGADRPLAS